MLFVSEMRYTRLNNYELVSNKLSYPKRDQMMTMSCQYFWLINFFFWTMKFLNLMFAFLRMIPCFTVVLRHLQHHAVFYHYLVTNLNTSLPTYSSPEGALQSLIDAEVAALVA